MAENNKEITYFAETDFRNKKTPFGIKTTDRTKHVYIIGKTGMGKSTLLESLVIQDIQSGKGVAFIDPHGGSAEKLLSYVPKERIKDVIYFAPHDVEYPVSFNVMEDVGKDQRHLVANGLMSSFKKIWPDVWSARMEYISMNIILALLEYPGSNLLGINRMLSDKDYRKKVVDNITDPSVKSFWVNEFAKYSDKIMVEAGASIQNKFGQFSSNPLIRNIIGQTTSSFSIRDLMDNKKIFIANLSKGRMGEINTNLIGGMLITKIYLGAMSRANATPEEIDKLPNFYLYVDEFQSFVNDSFADILSEARKYKLNLTIAHQYIEQMPETVRNAVFGNVGTTIAFRVGPFDAEVLEKIFAPKFTAEDIVNLGFAQIYLTLMIDGVGSQPFSARTLPPVAPPEVKFTNEVIENSRAVYAKPRDVVEAEIRKWHEAEPVPETKKFDKIEKTEKKGAFGNFDKHAVRGELENIKKDFGIKDFSSNKNNTAVKQEVSKDKKVFEDKRSVAAPAQSFAKPTIKNIQPEKKIIEKGPAPVSLNSLKSDSKEDKKSTGKNMDELKNILSAAMSSKGNNFSVGKIEVKKESVAPEEKVVVIEEDIEPVKKETDTNKDKAEKTEKTENTEEPKKVEENKRAKEVPEDVLRKILHTDTDIKNF